MLKLNVFFEIRVMLFELNAHFEFQFQFPVWYGMASDWRMTLASMHDICVFWMKRVGARPCASFNITVIWRRPN